MEVSLGSVVRPGKVQWGRREHLPLEYDEDHGGLRVDRKGMWYRVNMGKNVWAPDPHSQLRLRLHPHRSSSLPEVVVKVGCLLARSL